ncbi:MAG: TIM barrel protein [Pirellulales bacterium]
MTKYRKAAKKPTRRLFLTTAGQLAVGYSLIPLHGVAASAMPSRFTIGLSQYSLRALFKNGTLDPLDFPAFAVNTFGIETIDLSESQLPKDKLDDFTYLEMLRNRASNAGTNLYLLMAEVLDATETNRRESIEELLPSIKRTQALGCQFTRVFLKVPGEDPAAGTTLAVEALKPLADAAAKSKVTLVIEPGASPLSEKGAFLAEVAKRLDHPACRLMPDFGKLRNNVYEGTEAMLPWTATISCKMHNFDNAGNQPDFDYPRLIKMIAASEYRGVLAIEWEGERLTPIEGVKASQRLIENSLAELAS